MIPREHVPLAPLTTLGVGGEARFFIEAQSEDDIKDAITFARSKTLPLFILGAGSNLLVPDEGIEGVVVKIASCDISLQEEREHLVLTAGAGASWEDIVNEACARGVFGIENLAGIPGSLGGAVVQNIGAYGAELSSVFLEAETINSTTGHSRSYAREEAAFAYRTSYFKEHPEIIITRVSLQLQKNTVPNFTYHDLARAQVKGTPLSSPAEIATAVRAIRALKFPQSADGGCAGSFFKNPLVSVQQGKSLKQRFPDLPVFPQENGEVKISLAWILDHVLALKGFSEGSVRLYERQPLVIVARKGTHATEIDLFADEISKRVSEVTGIEIEREVETFGQRK